MKKNQLWLMLLAIAVTFGACKKGEDEPTEYTGTNEIYLEAEKDPILTLGDEGAIKVLLKATQRAITDTRFEFIIKSLNPKEQSVPVVIKEKEIILKKGERQTEFHLVVKEGTTIDSKGTNIDIRQYALEIPTMPDKRMKLNSNLRFRLLNVTVPALTEAQLTLIEGYKAKGMDITPFLGKIPVKVSVDIPADGLVEGFKDPDTKEYEGFSVITLSEHATANEPIFKMTYNPMGLTEFFYFALRKHTIENDEFWFAENAAPNYKGMCELIKWDRNSVEQFSASLDSVRVGAKQTDGYRMELVGKLPDRFDDLVNLVPFKFKYTAWDRLKKLLDEKDPRALDLTKDGEANPNPLWWLNNKDITDDEFDGGTFVDITGKSSWIVAEKKLKLFFTITVENGGDYLTVNAEYTGK